MYNINTSANVEFGALQTKIPWLAPMAAVEGLEEYWKTANTSNHAWLPWNHIDEDGQPIPPPVRPAAPQSSPAYVQQMQIAQNEMMMVSGQYQAQMGENENAKSGIAINARQRQGDRATYHFIDNLAIAVRFTGKILIDLIPKIYDTPRVHRISASDGSILNVTINTSAEKAYEKKAVPEGQMPEKDKDRQIIELIFNPLVGIYDVQSDTGPSFATRRQEAFNALTQIAAQNKEFMNIAGDILWKVADFPEAQVLMERWRKVIPPNITGDAPDPHTEAIMHQASDKIEQQALLIAQQAKQLQDKEDEMRLKHLQLDLDKRIAETNAARLDYEAESKRLTALGNSGPAVSVEQIQPLVKQLVSSMLNAIQPGLGDNMPDLPGQQEGGTVPGADDEAGEGNPSPEPPQAPADSLPDVPGSRQAPDGNHYVPDPNRPGKFMQVMQNA